MVRAVARCFFGFVVACVVCAAVQVSFVLPPTSLAGVGDGRLTAVAIWMLLATLHSAVFAAPFALVGLIFAERWSWRNPGIYAAFGVAIGLLGLVAQLVKLGISAPLIVLGFMTLVLLIGGGLGGLAYWLVAGRFAGRPAAVTTVG